MNLLPTSLAAHRAARREVTAARRQLRRELASFETPAQVNDLLALIADSDNPTADEMRSILTRNLLRSA